MAIVRFWNVDLYESSTNNQSVIFSTEKLKCKEQGKLCDTVKSRQASIYIYSIYLYILPFIASIYLYISLYFTKDHSKPLKTRCHEYIKRSIQVVSTTLIVLFLVLISRTVYFVLAAGSNPSLDRGLS